MYQLLEMIDEYYATNTQLDYSISCNDVNMRLIFFLDDSDIYAASRGMISKLKTHTYTLFGALCIQKKPHYELEVKNMILTHPVKITVKRNKAFLTSVKYKNCIFTKSICKLDDSGLIYEDCIWTREK